MNAALLATRCSETGPTSSDSPVEGAAELKAQGLTTPTDIIKAPVAPPRVYSRRRLDAAHEPPDDPGAIVTTGPSRTAVFAPNPDGPNPAASQRETGDRQAGGATAESSDAPSEVCILQYVRTWCHRVKLT